MIKKFYKIIPKKIRQKIEKKIINIAQRKLKNTECTYKIYIDDRKKNENQVSIITGASGAIGSAIAFRLAMQGATVVLTGRNQEKLNLVEKQIKNNGGKAETLIMDVTDAKNIKDVIENVYNKYSRIDILINNAGGSAREKWNTLLNQDVEVIDMILDTNLRGTILCTKYVEKFMINQKYGRIINIGSTTGVQGNESNVDYAGAKAGVIGATKSMAKELGKYNITVNCISPGRVNQIIFDKPLDDIYDSGSYLLRKGKTDEIAGVVSFFTSEDASFITGQNIIVDGGRSLGLKT